MIFVRHVKKNSGVLPKAALNQLEEPQSMLQVHGELNIVNISACPTNMGLAIKDHC